MSIVDHTRANRSLLFLLVALLFCLSAAAAYADGTITATIIVADPNSLVPPPVVDLSVIHPTQYSLTLTWTTPGEEATLGLATLYDIRFSLSPITSESEWRSASRVPLAPTPQLAASRETFLVGGLKSATTYYFAVKAGYYLSSGAGQEMLGWSSLSNCSYGTTLAESPAGATTIYLPTVRSLGKPARAAGGRRAIPRPEPQNDSPSPDGGLIAKGADSAASQTSPRTSDSPDNEDSYTSDSLPSLLVSDERATGERALDYVRALWRTLVASLRHHVG